LLLLSWTAVKNYLKITVRNRELDDFSYEF
jgi:hypothetical protein